MKIHAFVVAAATSLPLFAAMSIEEAPWIGDGRPERDGADWYAEDPAPEFRAEFALPECYPGWRHMIDRGATTLWETWKESDDTYSNCHPMFGSVDEWILRFGNAFKPMSGK